MFPLDTIIVTGIMGICQREYFLYGSGGLGHLSSGQKHSGTRVKGKEELNDKKGKSVGSSEKGAL